MNNWGIQVLQLNGVSIATHDPASATREFESEARALARRRELCKQREQGLREAERRIEAKRREVNRRAAAEEHSRREAREALGRRLLAAAARAPTLSQEAPAGRKATGRWTANEHDTFLKCLDIFGREWKKAAEVITTRTAVQIRSHAQKHFIKLEAAGKDTGLPDDLWKRCLDFAYGQAPKANQHTYVRRPAAPTPNDVALARKADTVPFTVDIRRACADLVTMLPRDKRADFSSLMRRLASLKEAGAIPSLTEALAVNVPAVVGVELWRRCCESQRRPAATLTPPQSRPPPRTGLSDRCWAEEREGNMPEKRPAGIEQNGHGKWRVRIKEVTVGTYATAAQAWAAFDAAAVAARFAASLGSRDAAGDQRATAPAAEE